VLITSLFRQGGEVLFRLEQGGTRGYFTKRLWQFYWIFIEKN